MRRPATIRIRVLTHADLLSQKALRYQMERASTFMDVNKTHDVYHMPVIALNLRDAQANRRQFIIFVVAGYTGYEAAKVNYFIQACALGEHGGMIIEGSKLQQLGDDHQVSTMKINLVILSWQ